MVQTSYKVTLCIFDAGFQVRAVDWAAHTAAFYSGADLYGLTNTRSENT